MSSDYLSLPKRSEAEVRRAMGKMPDHEFYTKLHIANEFERLATEIHRFTGNGVERAASLITRALDERASQLRGELSREADRQSCEARDKDERPWTAHRGTE